MNRHVKTAFLALALTVPGVAWADSHGGVDEEALARRITEQVMKELEKGDFLKRQIEQGIQDYVRQQRDAQARQRDQQNRAAAEMAKNVRRVSPDRDHIYGDPSAVVSLIEYSDFECPYCKRFHETARAAVAAYGGKVNWVYRHFPLEFHNPIAQKEAEASECARELGGNEGFWRYADAVYERTRSNKGFAIEALVPLAAELDFDRAAFAECFESGRHTARVLEDFEEGRSIGISGTPGNVLLNNETGETRLVSGAVPLSRLRSEIDSLIR